MTESESKYWLDIIVADILDKHPEGEIIVASGISPSASYHVGHFREVLTADAITRGIELAGRKAKHLHFSDNFDPLRKRYEFLPEEFEQYVGWPICLVPDPMGGCHENYAKHFYAEFEQSAAQMGVKMEVIFSYEDQYQNGKMASYIEKTLENIEKIQEVFERVSGRKLESDWTPIQVIDQKTKQYFNATVSSWDKAGRTIAGSDYTKGEAKLNWRLDWPARWALWGVTVEPFGRELATKGSSYDTGREFVDAVFESQAPYPVPYDTINLKGETKKMSSSLGNLITPQEALEIMPAEVLRYFVLRSRPEKTIYFDSGLGLYNLIEEYSKIESDIQSGKDNEFAEAYKLAAAGAKDRTISSIPFSHLVSAYQTARGSHESAAAILERTGYKDAVGKEKEIVEREFEFVKNWLHKYAPEEVKFELQEKLPDAELTANQKEFLALVAAGVEAAQLDGQGMHDLIYSGLEKTSLKPAEGFQAIYRVLLGKDSGPKAGWFLASLDKDWLSKRLLLEN